MLATLFCLSPVWPLAAVRAHVRCDAARLREAPVAHRAAEGLLARVRPAVRRQVGGLKGRNSGSELVRKGRAWRTYLRKRLGTGEAPERPLA